MKSVLKSFCYFYANTLANLDLTDRKLPFFPYSNAEIFISREQELLIYTAILLSLFKFNFAKELTTALKRALTLKR